MLKNIVISAALLLGTGIAQAEIKIVFDLNEALVQGSQLYITQNDKSLGLQFACSPEKSAVLLFEKTALAAMVVPAEDEYIGQAKVSQKDCERINKCALKDPHNVRISVSIDSETETFLLESLGENCKDI